MVVVTGIALLVLGGSIFDETYVQANASYEQGEYLEAVGLYEQLVSGGVVHPSVFYNLGNAYYKQGRIGPAIANYERALHLEPGLERARINMEHCLRRTERRLARPLPPDWEQSLLFWHYNVPLRTTYVCAVTFWGLFWVGLLLRLWRPLPYSRLAAGVLLVVAGAFGMSAWAKLHPAGLAVASSPVASVHYGMDVSETVRFELYEGDRIVVEEQIGEWVRVATASGERGWALKDHFTLVGPPYERAPASVDERGAANSP